MQHCLHEISSKSTQQMMTVMLNEEAVNDSNGTMGSVTGIIFRRKNSLTVTT
jgi:hypothetical protein